MAYGNVGAGSVWQHLHKPKPAAGVTAYLQCTSSELRFHADHFGLSGQVRVLLGAPPRPALQIIPKICGSGAITMDTSPIHSQGTFIAGHSTKHSFLTLPVDHFG